MQAPDTKFAGSIAELYDRYLGPLLFEPYAEDRYHVAGSGTCPSDAVSGGEQIQVSPF